LVNEARVFGPEQSNVGDVEQDHGESLQSWKRT
jgi:hypothetical protein